MALLAICAQPSLVRVFVAGSAILRNAKKRLAEIFNLDQSSLWTYDVIHGVALVARQSCVFPFQRVPRLLVIKSVRIPFDDGEIFAVMIGVALHAALARTLFQAICGVQTLVSIESRSDFRVAFQAPERGLSRRKLVTRSAIRRTIQRPVRARQRTRRNLGRCRARQEGHQQCGLDHETKLSDAKRASARRGKASQGFL